MSLSISAQASTFRSCEPIQNTPRQKATQILKKIWEAVKFIFYAAVTIGLYWNNPILFSVGFFVGIVADKQVDKAMAKIQRVWDAQAKLVRSFACFTGILTMQVILPAASLLWGANLGAKMSVRASS